jgi:GntR family transcriptional regulator
MSDAPVYKQIADILRSEIDNAAYRPGDQLPSESDLVGRFGTTRTTVRRALRLLTTEGRIESQRGRGVFVREVTRPDVVVRSPYERLARHHRESGRSSLLVDAESIGRTARQEVLELGEVVAPEHVAERLSLQSGDTVFMRRRRMWFGDDPTQLDWSYLPLDIAQGPLRTEQPGEGGTHARIEERGHRLTKFIEYVSLRMPTPREVRALRLGEGVPVVDLTQVSFAGERPVECFVAVLAGDKHRFEYDIPAD